MTASSLVVHRDPDILGGTPVFVGTRVPSARCSTISTPAIPWTNSWSTSPASLANRPSRR